MSDQEQNPTPTKSGGANGKVDAHSLQEAPVEIRSIKYNVTPDTQTLLDLNAKLAAKKTAVIEATGMIEKKGRNDRFGYEYAREADYLNHIRGAMADAGLAFSYTIVEEKMAQFSKTKSGSVRYSNRQVIEFTLTDSETGFAEHAQLVTYGIDSGDKGVWKGITGAVKYYLAKTFLVPTGDDPENDGGVKYLGERGKEKMYAYAEKHGIERESLDQMIEKILRLDPNQVPVPQSSQVKDLIESYSQALRAEPPVNAQQEETVDELMEDE